MSYDTIVADLAGTLASTAAQAAAAQAEADAVQIAQLRAEIDALTPKTLFGAFPGFPTLARTMPWAARLAAATATFGSLGVVRYYKDGDMTPFTAVQPTILSRNYPVADTLAGKYDALIDGEARSATAPVWLVPWHEADNNKLAPADFVNVFRYVAARVHVVNNPLVRMTPILMGFTVKGGVTATFDQFYPGDDAADAIGFDQYAHSAVPQFATAAGALSAPLAIAKAHGKPLVIGEVSLYPTYTDAQWTQVTADVIAALDLGAKTVAAVAWFNTNKEHDFRLDLHPDALKAWSAVTSRAAA